jgi:hypothetical protein
MIDTGFLPLLVIETVFTDDPVMLMDAIAPLKF